MSAILEKPNKSVFVSGNFFILHPGHIRLLKFASECGNKLTVGINNSKNLKGYPTPQERAEIIKELGFVDDVVVLDMGLKDFVQKNKPDLIIKGKEYESRYNLEEDLLTGWGGRLLFSSGESSYSDLDFIRRDLSHPTKNWNWPHDYIQRHACHHDELIKIINQCEGLNVMVIGDLIVDEYIQCEALGMSREDPTLVISPQTTVKFIGGSGIVAAHAKGFGSTVNYISVAGNDSLREWAMQDLTRHGVVAKIFADDSRPTTLKQRFRVGSKTMLRVSHLRQHEISKELQLKIFRAVEEKINQTQLLIFSDFSYGAIPSDLAQKIIKLGASNGVMMAADSQSSSQIGDLLRFSGVSLVTPTEYEARMALQDYSSGVHEIAKNLLEKTAGSAVAITMGESGALILSKAGEDYEMDNLPSLNLAPIDVSGAGDSLLVATALARASSKANIFQAAFLGAIAAAIQVGRIGNKPISKDELIGALLS